MDYLRRLLDYASGLILKLGSPARDSPAKAAHESLIKELSTVPSGSKDTQTAFFTTLVKGLRFIFEQLQVKSPAVFELSVKELLITDALISRVFCFCTLLYRFCASFSSCK